MSQQEFNLMAIDIGTQSTRAAIVSADGEILGIEQIAHEVDSPSAGWAQQRPDQWWEETARATQAVLQATGTEPESLAGVCVCGQMHGPVGIDEDGRVTTEWVQLWCDKRSAPNCQSVAASTDQEKLAEVTGNRVNPAWVGLKVLWCKENQPDIYERSRWFLVPKDFINYRLTGVAATDPSEGSGSYIWDWRNDNYSQEIASAVGVDMERFAPVSPSATVIGEVTESAATQTGIPAGVPVVAGGGDFPVSMLGFGIIGHGVASDVTGSSTLFATHSPEPLVHPAVQNLRHVVDGWIPFTILDCGGISMKWCRDLLNSAACLRKEDEKEKYSFEDLIEMASTIDAGSDGLFFHPYMMGERRAENTNARGGYLGLTLNHTPAHFVRATMEGVALAMGRDVALFRSLGLDVAQILCVGGGARNRLWSEIKATVVGVPLEIADQPEAGLKGAALLAAAGAGLIDDPGSTAVERRHLTDTVSPSDANSDTYEQALAESTRIYNHLLGFWPSI